MRCPLLPTLFVALATACGSPPAPAPEPARPVSVGGPGIAASVEDGRLFVRAHHPDPATARTTRAQLEALWLDPGSGPERVQLADWSAATDGTLAAEATAEIGGGDHRLRVSLRVADADSIRIEVVDRIGLPSRIRALGIQWRFEADAWDEVDAPPTTPDGRAADDAFHSPLLFVRSGRDCAALLPDLAVLNQDRRLPQEARLERTEGGALLLHGLRTLEPVELRGERLVFAHELVIRPDAEPFSTRAALHDRLWDRHAAPRLAHAAFPLKGETWDELESTALANVGLTDATTFVRLGERQNILHDALALAMVGTRRQDRALLDRATTIGQFVLEAPRRAGLLPGACRLDPATGERIWFADDGHAADADRRDFHTVDAATSARLLLELTEFLPELRPPIETSCADLARLLIQSQAENGRIPARFEERYLAPIDSTEEGAGTETAAAAWLLAVWGQHTGDADAHEAARRALAFLADGPVRSGEWTDGPRQAGEGSGPVPVRDSVVLSRTLHAAVASAVIAPLDTDAANLVTNLADELAARQIVWQPVWEPTPRLGAFAAANLPGSPSQDAATPLGAGALLDAQRVESDRTRVQRGAMALRRALLDAATPGAPSPALAVVATERVRAVFGQAVIDIAAGFGEGLDAVWFERLSIDGPRIDFRLLTDSDSLPSTEVRFRNPPPDVSTLTVPGETQRTATLDELEAGIALVPRRVPRVTFEPPTRIRAGAVWEPRARIEGPVSGAARASLILQPSESDDATPIRIPLTRHSDQLVAEGEFDTAGLAAGSVLRAWVEIADGDWQYRTPENGPGREIRISSRDAIDAGDEFESRLREGRDSSTVVRFVDGRENARRVEPGSQLVYRLPIRADALGLEVGLRYAGAVEVAILDDEHPDRTAMLHADGVASPKSTGVRTLELAVSDPRRWRGSEVDRFGRRALSLAISPAGDEALLLARLEWLATGTALVVPGESERELDPGSPLASIGVCVVPVALADLPDAPGRAALDQAFFGGAEYRVTPEPVPSLTVGSAAQWIDALSGGLTTLEGHVLAPVSTAVTSTALRDGDPEAVARLLEDVAPTLAPALRELTSAQRVVVLVHTAGSVATGNPVARVRTDGRPKDGGWPVAMLAERGEDGSYLSCGTIVLALMHAQNAGFRDLGEPEHGNFGNLALSSNQERHLPVLPAGINLVRVGWASRFEVERIQGDPRWVKFAPLLEGHALYELDSDTLPDRGRLLLELRDTGHDASARGLSIYRELGNPNGLVLRDVDGRILSPKLWRSSDSRPPMTTPFHPGTVEDLFQEERSFTDARLATPQGEAPWAIEELRIREDPVLRDAALSGPAMRIAWRGVDLLRQDAHGWSLTTVEGTRSPVAIGPETPIRRRDAGGAEITLPSEPGRSLQFRSSLPPRDRPARLFGRIQKLVDTSGEGRGILTLTIDGQHLFQADLTPSDRTDEAFVVDLPASREPQTLVLAFTTRSPGVAGDLVRLVTVPCSTRTTRLPLPALPTTAGRLGDGVIRSALRTMTVGERGTSRIRVPLVLPAGPAMLRLYCGRAANIDDDVQLRGTIRSLSGSEFFVTLDRTEIGPSRPMLLALCELPDREAATTAILDLELTGEPGAELLWIEAGIEPQ